MTAAALSKAVSVASLLITVPLTLHYLGIERYGMWATMSSFIALLTFADLGIGNGLLNQVSAAYGRDDWPAIKAYVSNAFFVLGLIASGMALTFALLYPFVYWPGVFNAHGELARHEAGPAIAALAFCIALNLPLSIVQKAQIGLQQGFIAALWNCLASVAGLAALLLAIRLHAGLHWLVLAFMTPQLGASLANTAIFFGVQRPEISPSREYVSTQIMSELMRTGLMFVALQIVVAVAYGSDNIIIAYTLGAAQVAEYSVPAQMFTLVITVLTMALGPLWPAYGEALSRQDHAWVRRTLARSIVMALGFAALAAFALLIAAPTILHYWIGNDLKPSLLLLLALCLWRIVDAAGNAVTSFLNGANFLQFELIILTLAGGAAVILKISLIHAIGVSGAAWGSIISYIAAAIPTAYFIRKRLGA